MAMSALHPMVVDFVDTTVLTREGELRVEEMQVGIGSPALPIDLGEIQALTSGVVTLVIKKADGSVVTKPAITTPLQNGDILVVIGTREQLDHLESILKEGKH